MNLGRMVFLKVIPRSSNLVLYRQQDLFQFLTSNIKVLHRTSRQNMSTIANKKQKTDSLTIGTHNGMFHCDEILACFMLQQLPKFADAKIIRTRDESVLSECDIVVDVGAVFNVEENRFDHHQKTFQKTLSSLRPELGDNYNVRLSSAGLIYTYFGEEFIRQILNKKLGLTDVSEDLLINVYKKVYENFFQEIDAIDNGVPMYNDEPLYKISTHLSARVSHYNSTWNSSDSYDAEKQFEAAQKLAGDELVDKICYYTKVWWPARTIVENALKNRFSIHESGEILELSEFCPWKEHFFELEKELKTIGIPKYVLVKNSETDYRVICVPLNASSFVCRKFLHKDWQGLRSQELVEISGIKDAGFVHASGFIGGSSSREGTFRMAIGSLEAPNES